MKRFVTTILLTSIISLELFVFLPQKEARATVPTWDVGLTGAIPTIITAVSVPGLQYAGHQLDKEFQVANIFSVSGILQLIKGAAGSIFSYDGIAKMLANVFINTLKNELITWIQSGFADDAEPFFLQDPERFFKEFGDQATGVFIEELGLQVAGDPNYFCSDFLPEIVLDLGLYGTQSYQNRARCTITDVVDNIEDYYDDFSNGRWNAFVKTRQSNNNRLDFYLMTLEENRMRRFESESVFRNASASGGGYLPVVDCLEENAVGCRKFRIKTPAKAIGDRVANSLDLDFMGLNLADEMSEVIQALINLAISEGLKSILDAESTSLF
ncbi:MAG: hypothetical protein O2794_02785 [bacterium]|nr:hypothetical protein [bacterium]